MISLTLEGPKDSLDLGALLDGTEGIQAIAGLTGAGMPSVNVQWGEGAGDGAIYRGQRVLPRNIDVPLYIAAETREGLRQLVKRLTMILAKPATLRLTDANGGEWTLGVVRVGGGDFIYGVDTDGETDLQTVVSLRAGQPLWTATTPVEVVKSSFTGTTMVLTNAGSADAAPVWEVRGPGSNLKITTPLGDIFRWNGSLANGETLFIDCNNGTVRDAIGNNRYAETAPAPRFPKVEPGTSTWNIGYPNAQPGPLRTNLFNNPNAYVNASGWADEAGGGVAISKHPTEGYRVDFGELRIANLISGYTAVTAGAAYTASITAVAEEGRVQLDWYNASGVHIGDAGGMSTPLAASGARISITGTAPAGATSARLRLILVSDPNLTDGRFMRVMLEKAPTANAYFDGNTADTVTINYAWSGTVGASASTMSLIPDRSTAQVRCRLKPREWMVI